MSSVEQLEHAVALVPVGGRMTPAAVKAQVSEIKELMKSALTEDVDYGTIKGMKRPSLLQPGAQWLLRWAGLGHTQKLAHIERDAEGRPYGATYTCVVFRVGFQEDVLASADGYCGYDEEGREAHMSTYNKPVPRSPWNTIIKMAQKRALVGAALAATAASGLFTQDVEDFQSTVQDDPDQWYREVGWQNRGDHDTWRKGVMDRMKKDVNVRAAFGVWREKQEPMIGAFADGAHTVDQAKRITEWLDVTAPAGTPAPEPTTTEAEAGAGSSGEVAAEPATAKEAIAKAVKDLDAANAAKACDHNWFEQDDHSFLCPECGEVRAPDEVPS